MEDSSPIPIPSKWRTISSAAQFLRQKTSSEPEPNASESELLKSIRATLRGTRGTSDSAVHTLYYSPAEEGLGEEELSWDTYTVVLSSGGVMRKRWSFEEEGQQVQWACIGSFEQPGSAPASTMHPNHWTNEKQESKPAPSVDLSERPTFGPFARAREEDGQETEPATIVRAVYIFLRSMGRIFLSNGLDYTFHLPFIVRRAWPLCPHGVGLQRILDATEIEEAKLAGDVPLPTLFTLVNPFREPAAVGLSEGIICRLGSGSAQLKESDPDRFTNTIPPEEHLVWVSPREDDLESGFAVSVNPDTKQISIWRYAYVIPKVEPRPIGRSPSQTTSNKRLSMPGNARRQTLEGAGGRPSLLPPPVGEFDPLGPLHGALPSTTPMAAMVGGGAAVNPDWLPSKNRLESMSKHDLSMTMDRMVLGGHLDTEALISPLDTEKYQPAYWMQRLGTEPIPLENLAALDSISVACFDKRWNGQSMGCLIGVCLPVTQSLLLFRISTQADHTLSFAFEARRQATSIVPLRATRASSIDLLILKPRRTLALLTHGIYELPLKFDDDWNDEAGMEIDSGMRAAKHSPIVRIGDAVSSSVNITLIGGSTERATIDLVPKDYLTTQCLLMLSMAVPGDEAFQIHSQFLENWSKAGFLVSDGTQFNALKSSIYKTFGIQAETAPSGSPDAVPSDAWTNLSQTSSATRFREDPVLKGLRVPRRQSPLVNNTVPSGKPHHLLASVLNGLHHIAEDMRLMVHRHRALLSLVPVICKIAMLIRPEWADYWKRLVPDAMSEWPSPATTVLENVDDRLPVWPPDMAAILYGRINNPEWSPPWPEPEKFAQQFKITASFGFGLVSPLPNVGRIKQAYSALADNKIPDTRKRAENALNWMVRADISQDVMRYLPLGIVAPLREAARTCQLSPGGDWPVVAYELIGRNDLAEGLDPTSEGPPGHGYRSVKEFISPKTSRKSISDHIEAVRHDLGGEVGVVTGVELEADDFTEIRFGQDRRLEELARMLCSATIPTIRAIERPELNEHDQSKEQQHQVVRMAERTLALPLGRALFTFGSIPSVTKEAFAIPKIEFSVRLQPMNIIMAPEPGKIPIECTSWGEFHNGVAAGLRISSKSKAIESSWIKFNKPSELTPEHAGFLYALGLTGHLKEMLTWHTFSYLTPKHDMTSIGVLLGLSAANVGTSNKHVTKLLAVHTPALLPTPTVDLNVPLITQAAGLSGIGLLYMGTKNRRMAEVSLTQISRADLYQPDLSNEYREAYTLSAALSFGMVMLGKGAVIPADEDLVSRLRVLIHGEGHVFTNSRQRPSFDVNLTSPAATIALGMMFLKTERHDVADILAIPDTILALNSIQPSFLLLRTLARALIMWDAITPSNEWITTQIPQAIGEAMAGRFHGKFPDDAYELAYYNILAGCCFAIALKYAGTAQEAAYLMIIHYYDMFSQLAYTNSPAFDHRIKRSAVREGLNLISISLNMVMAGTGEINCLRRLRYSYGMYNQPIRYGTHVANHMSLGLLFLGGGRYTLGTSDAAIACMIAAFFPRFAPVSSDNKCYLQALRHLWVLAAEPRCLIARDVDTKEVVYLPVKIKVKEGKDVGTSQLISPTLIPDLDKLLSIRVDTPRYWPFYLDIANLPRHKQSLLSNQTLFVKRRTAFLSYMEDPKGSRSLFVRSGSSTGDAATLDFPQLTDLKAHPASDLHHFITSFSNDTLFLAFADRFCRDDGETAQEKLFQVYCHASLLDSILLDKSQTIQAHLTLYRFRTMSQDSRYYNLRLQDLRFATDFYNKIYDRRFSGRSENNPRPPLLREDTLSGALHALDAQLDTVRQSPVFQSLLARYVLGEFIPTFPLHSAEYTASRQLSWYLQRNSVPVSTLLVVLKGLALQAHDQCLSVPPPQGTDNAVVLDQGIKEVLHATGTQMTTTLGSGWSMRSLDEVIAAWNAPPTAP